MQLPSDPTGEERDRLWSYLRLLDAAPVPPPTAAVSISPPAASTSEPPFPVPVPDLLPDLPTSHATTPPPFGGGWQAYSGPTTTLVTRTPSMGWPPSSATSLSFSSMPSSLAPTLQDQVADMHRQLYDDHGDDASTLTSRHGTSTRRKRHVTHLP